MTTFENKHTINVKHKMHTFHIFFISLFSFSPPFLSFYLSLFLWYASIFFAPNEFISVCRLINNMPIINLVIFTSLHHGNWNNLTEREKILVVKLKHENWLENSDDLVGTEATAAAYGIWIDLVFRKVTKYHCVHKHGVST